ncbi:MAG: hypothetical protein GXY85_11675 [Candidatus Brocadiaceae bacterium]|nr:hypothetical protein [Candidatus Brocadiaceae bacterium]
MKRLAMVAVACALLCVCSGCFRTSFHAENLPYGVSMTRPDPATESVVYHFEQSRWNHYFLYGLIPTSDADMERFVGRHVAAGQGVRNLRIRHGVSFTNALMWALVGGIYNPMTTTVSGDVVQVRPAGSGL